MCFNIVMPSKTQTLEEIVDGFGAQQARSLFLRLAKRASESEYGEEFRSVAKAVEGEAGKLTDLELAEALLYFGRALSADPSGEEAFRDGVASIAYAYRLTEGMADREHQKEQSRIHAISALHLGFLSLFEQDGGELVFGASPYANMAVRYSLPPNLKRGLAYLEDARGDRGLANDANALLGLYYMHRGDGKGIAKDDLKRAVYHFMLLKAPSRKREGASCCRYLPFFSSSLAMEAKRLIDFGCLKPGFALLSHSLDLEKGLKDSQRNPYIPYNLALCCLYGVGTPIDRVKANEYKGMVESLASSLPLAEKLLLSLARADFSLPRA